MNTSSFLSKAAWHRYASSTSWEEWRWCYSQPWHLTGTQQSVSPIHYLNIMNPKICVSFVIAGWVIGVIHAMSQFAFIINLPFCGPNEVDSFYCDFPRIIKLACTVGDKFEFIIAASSGFMTMGTFFLLIFSYIFILVTVWKRSSGELSMISIIFVTLSAHITVVVLFFTPCMFLYVWPFPTSSIDKYLFISDFAITPILNPIIYKLRNKDIKVAIKRLSKRTLCQTLLTGSIFGAPKLYIHLLFGHLYSGIWHLK